VSHDRHFIDHLATKIFEIGGGEVRVYPGNYEDYLWRKQRDAEPSEEARTETAPAPQPPKQEKRIKRVNPIKLRQMKEQCGRIEEGISEMEMAIAQTERELSSFQNAAQTMRLTARLEEQRTLLEEQISEWEALSHAIREAES
jgi:ATP-binding cassette subfamily F protein 3